MTRFILDTDHLSLLQRGFTPVVARVSQYYPDAIAITIITVEEQLRGRLAQVNKASNPTQLAQSYLWLHETFDSLSRLRVLDFDERVSDVYAQLRKLKLRVGTQDLRIAAIALTNDCTLVTRNTQDFEDIPNLQLENWTV